MNEQEYRDLLVWALGGLDHNNPANKTVIDKFNDALQAQPSAVLDGDYSAGVADGRREMSEAWERAFITTFNEDARLTRESKPDYHGIPTEHVVKADEQYRDEMLHAVHAKTRQYLANGGK